MTGPRPSSVAGRGSCAATVTRPGDRCADWLRGLVTGLRPCSVTTVRPAPGQVRRRDRTAIAPDANVQVVAPGVERRDQVVADGLQVGEAPLDFSQLLQSPHLQPRVAATAATGLDQVSDLHESETESLRGLDHAERRDGLFVAETVSARTPIRSPQKPSAFVVAQRLPVDTSGFTCAFPRPRGEFSNRFVGRVLDSLQPTELHDPANARYAAEECRGAATLIPMAEVA